MRKTRFAVLGLFLCSAMAFQLFMPPTIFDRAQTVEANTDELSDTFWNVDGTILSLEFDNSNRVTLLRKRSRGGGYDRIATGRYRVRRNIVTFTFDGESANATISGRNRNIMTGRFYVDNKPYRIRATRQN